MSPRYKKRVDNNQSDIVSVLESIPGVKVAKDHDDIIVGFRNKNFWYEIKNPEYANKKGVIPKSRVRKSQHDLKQTWTGHYRIVCTVDEILADLGIKRS